MKVIEIDKTDIKQCVKDAQHERVIVTRRGKPIAVIAGVEGMDLEQIALGHSDEFWQLIRERRRQKTIGRADLEKQLTKPSGSE